MPERPAPDTREWAALIYIAGDNFLSKAAEVDLRDILSAGAANPGGDGLNSLYIGVEIDTLGTERGSSRLRIASAEESSRQDLPERDSGSSETLGAFLRWGVQSCPARKYMVVIWGHGDGFRVDRSFAPDENGTWLTLPGVREALESADLGAGAGRPLALLGFDACLMAMTEIAAGLEGCAEVLVASQQQVPGSGWPYRQVLQSLSSSRYVTDAESLGRAILDHFVDEPQEADGTDVALSAIRLSAIEPVEACVGLLGQALARAQSRDGSAIKEARDRAQSFMAPDYLDLIDLCDELLRSPRLAATSRLRAAAGAAKASAAAATAGSRVGGQPVLRANGLSIWFPRDADLYTRYRSDYLALVLRDCPECGAPASPRGHHQSECRSRGAEVNAGPADWVQFLDRYHGYAGLNYQQQPPTMQAYPSEDRRQTTIRTKN